MWMWNIYSILLWCMTFLGEPLLILLPFIGLGYYIIQNDEEKIRKAFKLLEGRTISSSMSYQYGKLLPSGIFVGFQCIGYYNVGSRNEGTSSRIHIITSPSIFNSLIKNDENVYSCEKGETIITEKKKVEMYSVCGSYADLYYSSRHIDVTSLRARGEQNEIVSKIKHIFNTKGRATIFLHGVSGAGKSTVGFLLAKELDASFCHSFNPTSPNHNLNRLAQIANLAECPLILVIEEVDTMIKDIHANRIPLHKEMQIAIYNKSTYNTFMDDMFFFKNMILIMTSNTSYEAISEIDPSYLRRGRVDACYSMMTPLICEQESSSSTINS